ncbi:hypothetical protein [Parasphingorhabdus sp. NYA22]
MNRFTLSLSAAIFALASPAAVLAEHHEGGVDGHQCEKTEDGKMKCCMTDKDGKKACHMMEGDKMDHSKMDHSKMDHGNMADSETPDANPE